MGIRIPGIWLLVGTLLCAFASAVHAGEASATDAGDLSQALARASHGDRIRVVTLDASLEGKYRGFSDGMVRLQARGDMLQFPADSVRAMSKQHRHGGKGFLVGALSGFAIGVAIGATADESGETAFLGGISLGVIGGALGWLIGHANSSWEPLYP